MLITSTKLAANPSADRAQTPSAAGVILAAPEITLDQGDDDGVLPAIATGMYVFPASPDASDPLTAEIAGIAKTLSVSLASQLHPHLATGVRAGWIVVGAISLFQRAKEGELKWHEVALHGGELALDSYRAANSALPENLQLNAEWCEGTSCLLEAATSVAHGGDANQFVIGQTLDQSPPLGQLRKLMSIAAAAQHPNSKFSFVSANPIDVTVQESGPTARRAV